MTVHVIETDSKHPLVERAKADPALYRRRLIEPDGHIGLELAGAAIARFQAEGFETLEATPLETGPFHPRLIVRRFANEYAAQDEEFAALAARRARSGLATADGVDRDSAGNTANLARPDRAARAGAVLAPRAASPRDNEAHGFGILGEMTLSELFVGLGRERFDSLLGEV
ncbi:MAG: hypothetical protein R2748_30075 [Bryobacterales bacterium]